MSYTYQKQLAHQSNYGGARNASQIKYIVIHYTGNDGDRAGNNAKYFQIPGRGASAHYFVDDETVYQSVPDLSIAWSVGGNKCRDCAQTGGGSLYRVATNMNTLNIELCDTKKDGTVKASEKTIENAVKETLDWLEDNESATVEELESKKTELENIANPIMSKFYQQGAPQGSEGASDDDDEL